MMRWWIVLVQRLHRRKPEMPSCLIRVDPTTSMEWHHEIGAAIHRVEKARYEARDERWQAVRRDIGGRV